MCKYCDSVLNVKVVTFPIYDNAEENIPKMISTVKEENAHRKIFTK